MHKHELTTPQRGLAGRAAGFAVGALTLLVDCVLAAQCALHARLPTPVVRRRYLSVAATVLAAAGLATVAATTAASMDQSDGVTVAAIAQLPDNAHADRINAALRADRSSRDPAPRPPAPPPPPKPRPKPKPAYVMPKTNYVNTSCYGYRTVPYPQFHQGTDLASGAGTPNMAMHSGRVIMAGDTGDGYGRKVVIDHGHGVYTLYGHGSRVLVHVGQWVHAGQVVSLEGATGDVTGPHLHFEVWIGMWHRVNPATFLRAHGVPYRGC